MMTAIPNTGVHVERANLTEVRDALAPLCGGVWLATDLATRLHWTIEADRVTRVTGALDGPTCRAFGVATVCSPDGVPVFLINERDTILWIEPDTTVAVRELGRRSCEIRLERLDDIDARTVSRAGVERHRANGETLRTIALSEDRLLPIYDQQLPTGDPAADDAFAAIETTLDARERLTGPAAGLAEVLDQMEADLARTLRASALQSYVWAAVLRERIATMRATLDAAPAD